MSPRQSSKENAQSEFSGASFFLASTSLIRAVFPQVPPFRGNEEVEP